MWLKRAVNRASQLLLSFNQLFLLCLQKTFMFFGFFCKKRLRVVWNNLRTPFTGGAEAHNGAADG
ncbi:hypothetical protein SAMN05421685_1031, partial [Thalassovita mediterranea]